MKRIVSLLAAVALSLYTFYSTCWYAPSSFFNMAVPFVFAALAGYALLAYVLSKRMAKKV
ncbi:hypothetical protein [Methanolobus psychrotolerans]|uniref:hypothetical protein n=1 Tax=Methanolobus psychrotolerans TaxID=1874706 RepID=UPI000B91731F|nr:hypothetical protein [Methanolobus psychrotolerans]